MIVIHFGCFSPLTFYEFINIDALVKSRKIPLPRWERGGVRVKKAAFQLLTSPSP
jgi:hypothetical protein